MNTSYCPAVVRVANKVYIFVVRFNTEEGQFEGSGRKALEFSQPVTTEIIKRIFTIGNKNGVRISLPMIRLLGLKIDVIATANRGLSQKLGDLVEAAGESNRELFLIDLAS